MDDAKVKGADVLFENENWKIYKNNFVHGYREIGIKVFRCSEEFPDQYSSHKVTVDVYFFVGVLSISWKTNMESADAKE